MNTKTNALAMQTNSKKTSIVTLFGERKSKKKNNQLNTYIIGNVKCVSLNFIPELCSSLRHNIRIAQIVNFIYFIWCRQIIIKRYCRFLHELVKNEK